LEFWLSSQRYILSFNRFILKQIKLDRNSRVLDIWCGIGKIISNLSNKLKLHNKPIGIDIENHKDKSKKIIFKKTDALSFVSKTKINFDLILIKQTIHLVKKKNTGYLDRNLSHSNYFRNFSHCIISFYYKGNILDKNHSKMLFWL